jgi:UDP-GlcNAc3NAcA epimerase
MPEEINRIMADHASTLLFSPTETGLQNLMNEGFDKDNQQPFTADQPGIFHCGDVMYDNSLYFRQIAEEKSDILKAQHLEEKTFFLATVHRDNNTDQPERLNAIFEAFLEISQESKTPLVLPLHPRTANLLGKNLDSTLYQQLQQEENIRLIPPVSFLDMIMLESRCEMVFTDSGGVQKEAYFFEKPTLILRSETEWKEIVEQGCGIVVNADKNKIMSAFDHFSQAGKKLAFPALFGDGKAAEFIAGVMVENQL